MKIGHIYLERESARGASRFMALVEAVDRLAVDQHVLVAEPALARRLNALPFATVGSVVRSPVMACCLMPEVDVVHVHDEKGGRAGLLLTLTRSLPVIVTSDRPGQQPQGSLERSVFQRARAIVDPALLESEWLVDLYRKAAMERSELPQNSDCG